MSRFWKVALVVTLVLVVSACTGLIAVAGAQEGWSCETGGDHICDTDRWVEIVQYQESSAGLSANVTRQTPTVAVRRFYRAPGMVCVLAARRGDGTIDRWGDGTICHR